MEEENFEIVRNGQKLPEIALGLLGDGDELLGPVAHLHDGEPSALVVHHLLGTCGENFFGQDAGTCRKIENLVSFRIHIGSCFEK